MSSASRPEWFPTDLFPFESRFLDVDESRIHYVDEGTGPTLLFLHGNPTWSFLYRTIVERLRVDFRCVAVDHPGFGLSTAPPGYGFTPREHAGVLERFVERLDLRDATMMVHDWGGPIGLWVAGRQPERFRALVIGNTWAWPVNGDLHFEWFSKLMGGPAGRVLIRHLNLFVNGLIPAGTKTKVPGEVMSAYRGPFTTRDSRRATSVLPREITRGRDFLLEVESGLAGLAHLPALITWGDKDIAARDVERRRFEELFPDHRTVILENAGHFIQEDAPGRIVDAIREWYPDVGDGGRRGGSVAARADGGHAASSGRARSGRRTRG